MFQVFLFIFQPIHAASLASVFISAQSAAVRQAVLYVVMMRKVILCYLNSYLQSNIY